MADPFELEVAAAVEAEKRRKAADDSFELEVAASVAAKKGQAKVSEPGAPATVQEQIAIGVQPYDVDTNFYAEEGELWKAAREYGVRTGEANPDEYATRLVMEKRRNVNKQDETDLTSPFFVEAATKKVKDSTDPGSLSWRAADAFGMRQYGEPTPKTSEVGWKVATTEHEREVGRALLYKNLMDSGVPESEAKVKAWAAWERGEELQVPTRENVTLSASPMVDPKVVDPKLRDDLKQAGTDMLSGLAETARDAANVAKDATVDTMLAAGEVIPRATGTMTEWADTLKGWRDAAFPSPTKAAADWLAQSDNENLRGFAERLKYAHDRDTSGAANFATGMAEMNNALNDALGGPDIAPIVGLTRVDPSQPGILNALASIPMSAPKHTVELPVPSAEEMVQHEKDAAVQYANQLQGSWSAFLQGDLEGSAAVAEAMQTGGGALSLVTTPVMDAFMIASRTPDPTERETALGWFFRTVPSASFNLGSVWIARAADYAARKSGAESWRQNRVPTGEAPTAAEALVPFWSGSYWHDWLTAVRNGDSLTPEFMRFADTMAYGMPGLSDEQRVRWMGTVGDEKAGAYRHFGTNLAMAADLLVPMDRAPHIAWGGVESAGRFHEVYNQARQIMAGTPDGGNRALQTATATVAPSLTHQYLMRSDPEYRAAWDAVEQQSVRAQEEALAGQGRPLDEVVRNVTPDIDSVRLAVARAWARKAVESGYNPAAIDPRSPRVARDIANAYREYLTTLRIGKEGEDGTVAVTPDGEPPHVNEPATVQALVWLGYDPDVARTMPEADAVARIAERRRPDGSESPPEPVRDDALHSVVDEVDGLYTVAVDENVPALGKWSDITLSEADPVKRLALMRAEVEQHIGAPFDTITGQLPLQSALSFVDPKTGQYVRAPRLTRDALTQYAPADIEFALNRLLNATPEQVWRNAGTFERGGVAKWVDEGPVTRERVSLALNEAIRNKAIDATEQDVAAFMAVQDRVAQRLTDLGVVKSPSEWWSQAEHHLGSIREKGARGSIEYGKTGAAIITLAKTANLSTLFHENAHALRRILPADHMKALDGFVTETYGGWDVRAEEWFARQFESVLRTGDIIPKSAPPTWTERLTAALRYAADVLRSIYRDGELPEVHPIFRQWMDEFIVGGGKVAPVDGGGLAVPKPEPVVKTVKPTRKKETVRARPGEPTMPAAARDGWSPKMLEDFARKADEVRAIKDAAAQNKAVQAWLSAIHAVIGEDVGIRAKRHRLAGGIGTKILDMMLNAGRQIVDGMTPEARSTADAAYTGKAAPVSKSETTAPVAKPVKTKRPPVPPPPPDVAPTGLRDAVAALHAAADAGDVKATVAAIKGVTDAVTAAKATVTPEAKKAFIGAVKAATKGADVSVAVRAATDAYLNAAGMGMHEYPAPSARPNHAVPPQLPDVLLPTPAPTPIPLPPEAAAIVYAQPLPSGGTDTINQYGLKRVVVGKGGNVDVTVATVDINSVIAPDVDVAFTATFDPLLGSSVLGLDVNTGSPVLAMVDSTYTPVTGAKRLAAMKELHRRGLAGEEPYATRLAALQNHMSSAAMAMGIQQPKPGEVLVRVVGSNPKVTKSVSGVANKGVVSIRVDAPAWATLPPEVTHAAWASTADVVRQVAELPYSVDMPDALARVVADGIALYTESVRSGQSIRAAAERMVDHYVAAKNAKALAVSDASVAVADAVANGRLVEHVKSMDVESVAVEHEMAVDHARRLEMTGIEHNIKNTVMPTEPPGYAPVKDILAGGRKKKRVSLDNIMSEEPKQPVQVEHVPDQTGHDAGAFGGARYAHEAVAWIAKNEADPSLRRIAEVIAPMVQQDVKLFIVQPGEAVKGLPPLMHSARGVYRFDARQYSWGGEVWIRGSKFSDGTSGVVSATVLHESIHSVVNRKIHEGNRRGEPDGPAKRGAQAFYAIQHAVMAWYNEHIKAGTLPEYAKSEEFRYAISDPMELASYGFTDKGVQDAFKQIVIPGLKTSVWSKFVAAVRDILGLAKSDDSVLARIIDATNILLEQDAPVKKLLQSSQTDTPQFKAWFGKSKVVDESGKPLVVYHGTGGDYQVLNAFDGLTYFTNSRDEASAYAATSRSGEHVADAEMARKRVESMVDAREPIPTVIDAFDDVFSDVGSWDGRRNAYFAVNDELWLAGDTGAPKLVRGKHVEYTSKDGNGSVVDGPSSLEIERVSGKADLDAAHPDSGPSVYPVYLSIKNPFVTRDHMWANSFSGRWDASEQAKARREIARLKSLGYDGIVAPSDTINVTDGSGFGSTVYVPFTPEQIKSAIGNRGTFDPTNPNILYQHTEHISPMAPRDPLTGDTLPVPQGDVGVIPGKDAPSRFSAEVEGQDSVISPAGQKLARGRAIPLLSREEINLALGYRADQSVYPARELAERVLAQALVSRLQASESRMAYEPISNRISVPKQRAAAVKARAMVILGDTPEIIVKAGERRPADVGVIADESPSLNLTPQEAGKVLLVLDYLRHTGWSESLPKPVRAMDINDLQTRFTADDYRAIAGAVHDSVSGAAPYRADISRYSLARNIVWKLAQRPDGVFTPQPLETTAGWGAKVVNQARSIIGATILTGANFILPFDTIPSMRPDIRPAWERARRELLSSAAELAEAVTTAVETVGAKKGAMVDALVRVSAASKGWRTLVDVMPRDNGPSDLTRLRRWLYNGDPEHARQNALGTYDYVPHDLPRTVEDRSRGIVARPITDAPAEVYAHADVVERVIMAHPRSVDALSMRLIDQIRNRTLTPEDAVAVIGKMHVILNECAQTGVNALTAAAGHSGMKDHVKKVLEGTASKRGLALDAYEALFTYRWSDEPVQGVQPVPPAGKPATPAVFASIESMVRMLALSIGKENVRLRTDLWAFDVINRLNAEEIKNRLIDELVDLDYAHDLSTMADAAGHTFGSLAEEVRFAEEVKRAVNYEMWGTNYTRETRMMQDENGNPVVVTTGRGNVEVNVKEEHISPEAMAAARVIIAKTGIRPDVLTTRKGYKGELSSAPVGSRLVSLMNDPTRMLERANDPTTWRSEGSLFTSRGRDVYLPDTVLKSLDEAIEMAAPLTERLAATLSERQLPVGVFRRVEDAFRQLKGSLITGGRSGYLTTAALVIPLYGGAHILDAATLALGVHALSYLPRSMGYMTNAMGAVMQGVMELGVFRSADAVGRRGRMAYRAMQDTIRFRKMGTFVDGARAATLAVMEKAAGAGRGAESVMFTTQNGHVYSLADVVRIGRDYGLDGTQARVESAAKTQVALDALYKKYDREPGVVGKLWSEITSFYERDALTENYRRMYEAVDTFFRYVWLLDGLDKGLPVHEAVSRSLRISFDYTAVAPVDRLVNFVYMFWMYQRRAIDLTVAAMIENPTGVNGLIRFMRAQDLTNGYSDLDEDYVRQSETVPDYAMARPAIDVWKVAGSKSSHMKQLFSEPPVAAATKMISDMATVDLIGLGSRAQPHYLYIINLLNGMVGGDYIDFFRKEAKEGESSAAPVSPVFVRMDQAITGGKFQNVLGYHMRYEGDPMRQPAPGAPYTFEVPSNKRVVWDAMNMIPGFANLLGNMDIHDRSDTYVDSVLEEYLRLLGSPMEVPPDSVVYPAPNQTPRPNVGLDNERDRFLGFTPAVIATPYAARARAPAMTKEALAEELRKKLAEIRRMKEAEVDQGDVMGPSELTPDRNIGIDPNKPMGVEK